MQMPCYSHWRKIIPWSQDVCVCKCVGSLGLHLSLCYISAVNYRWWGWWSAAGMGHLAQLHAPPALPLLCQVLLAESPFPKVSRCPVGCAKSQQECLQSTLSTAHIFLWVCVCVFKRKWCQGTVCRGVCVCVWGGGFLSVLALLTSRRSLLPGSSMSAHTPLPCRLDLSVGGDDGENLGSRRGADTRGIRETER